MKSLWLIVAVQIITESLPISSSSHLRLTELLFLSPGSLSCLPNCFDQLLHGPTIVVIMLFFFRDWFRPARFLILGLLEGIKQGRLHDSSRKLLRIFFKLLGLMAVCCAMPVIMMYGVIKPFLAHTSWFASTWVMVIGLAITSVLLLSLRLVRPSRIVSKKMFPGDVLTLGLVQALSLLPGISRFASTYVAARWLGFEVRRAFQICFLIEFPLIVAGFGINGIGGLMRTPGWINLFSWEVVTALVISTIAAYVLLWVAWWMARTRRLWWFGVYVWIPIIIFVWSNIISSN